MTNDILNNLFEKPIIKCGVGRPKKERRPVGRPIGSKNKSNKIKLYPYSIHILNIIFINCRFFNLIFAFLITVEII